MILKKTYRSFTHLFSLKKQIIPTLRKLIIMFNGMNHKTILNVYFILIDLYYANLPCAYLSPQKKI